MICQLQTWSAGWGDVPYRRSKDGGSVEAVHEVVVAAPPRSVSDPNVKSCQNDVPDVYIQYAVESLNAPMQIGGVSRRRPSAARSETHRTTVT